MSRIVAATRVLASRLVRGSTGEILGVLAGFLVLTIGMTYPLVVHLADALPNDLGDPLLNATILAWDADRLRHGLRGLWDAPFFFPYPGTLAYSEHLLGIALFVAPVEWATTNPVFAYNAAFLGSYVLAGCGMYLLVRELTGHRAAAWVAGVAFACCPYRADQTSHLQVLMSGWMPVALWALHRYLATGRRTALAAFVAAFLAQGLSNGYYLYFFTLPTTLVVIHGLARARDRRRLLTGLGAAALVVVAVLSPVGLAYYRVQRELGFRRDLAEMQSYSADLASYLRANPSLWVWRRVLRTDTAERKLFPGLTVVVLAGIAAGLAARRSPRRQVFSSPVERAARLYLATAAAAIVLSLGPEPRAWGRPLLTAGPYRWLVAVVPGLDGLRVPARMAMVVFLALAVLAGLAVARLLRRVSGRARHLVGVGLATAIAVEGYAGPLPYARVPAPTPAERTVYTWLAQRPAGGVLELPVEGREPTHSLLFQYRSLQHGHPIVNGYSGLTPPLDSYLRSPGSPLSHVEQIGEVLRGLRLIGVRYIVVHEKLFDDRAFARATLDAIRQQPDQVEASLEAPGVAAFSLRGIQERPVWKTRNLRQVAPTAFAAAASHGSARIGLAFDNDPQTRWSTGQAQAGDEWLELRFDRPRALARLRFEMAERSLGDYPRRLRVEASRDGTTFGDVLFEDATLPALLGALARPARTVVVEVDLAPNKSRAIRLRQTGRTRTWFWSIDELTVWEQRTTP